MDLPNSSISNFKRFLTGILLPLLLIVGIVGYAFNYFFEQKIIFTNPLCGAFKINRIITETHTNEIPIFGSSRAEGSFIPDSLGTDYFDYGLSGSKLDVALFFLKEECKKKKQQRNIIMALDFDDLIPEAGDIGYYIPNAAYAPVRQLMGKGYKPYYALPFLRYYGTFDTYFKLYLNNKLEVTKVSNKGASLEKNEFSPAYFNMLVEIRNGNPTKLKIDTALASDLLKLVAAHAERNFIFVVTPYHSSFMNSIAATYPLVDSYLKQLTANKNVTLLDYSRMPLADNMYLNTTHINWKGAIAFNHALKDTLNSLLR